MEIVEEQNPLQILVSSTPRVKTTYNKTNTNSAGRPKRENVIIFGPEPKSVVSQLLKEKTSERCKQKIQINDEVTKEYAPEFTDEPLPKKQQKSQEIKSYHCEYESCTYKTTSSSNMIKHKRRHTSEKPYMCDQCTFRTNFINSLTVHKRIHSGERPFICEHCSYCCNSSSNLKKHCMHKHAGVT